MRYAKARRRLRATVEFVPFSDDFVPVVFFLCEDDRKQRLRSGQHVRLQGDSPRNNRHFPGANGQPK